MTDTAPPTLSIDELRAMLAANAGDPDAPLVVEEMRAGMAAITETFPPHPDVQVTDASLGGVRAKRLVPPAAKPGRTLLYFHGGGYVIGSPETHLGLNADLARLMGAEVWSMDYRLAPEHAFPAAIEDGVAAYRGLIEAGIDPGGIFIGGDSAGGGATVATAVKARDEGLPMPAGLILLSPWVNLANTGWSYETRAAADPMISHKNINWFADTYLAGSGHDASHPLASPLRADLAGLPPMLIQVGSDECLLSDSVTLAERAGAAQVDVTLEIWPRMIHIFQIFHPILEEARRANAQIAAWSAAKAG